MKTVLGAAEEIKIDWSKSPAFKIVIDLHISALDSITMHVAGNISAFRFQKIANKSARYVISSLIFRAALSSISLSSLDSFFKNVVLPLMKDGKMEICSVFFASLMDRMMAGKCLDQSNLAEVFKFYMLLMSSRSTISQSCLVFTFFVNA
jgi:hypothetical protein